MRTIATACAPATASPLRTPISPVSLGGRTPPSRASRYPGWIASDPAKLDLAQAAIYTNCEPTSYPYVLARAHELAVVGGAEKEGLEQMLFQTMLRNGLMPEISFKATNKLLTGGGRR